MTVPRRRSSFQRHREVIAPTTNGSYHRPIQSEQRDTLLRAIVRGRSWLAEILAGQVDGPDAIAVRERCSRRQVNATISLASIAPDIVDAVAAGRLPQGVSLRGLTDPPLIWSEQRSLVGVQA